MRRFYRSISGIFFLDMLGLTMFCMILFIVGSFIYCVNIDNPRKARQSELKLQEFLAEHGDKVKIVRLQDELKRELQGKSINTVRRVWLCCQFADGYTIELEQYHGGPTTQVPLVDETWQLGTYQSTYSAKFGFVKKVER